MPEVLGHPSGVAMKPGRPPTDRSPGRWGRAVRVNLSAAEHAAYVAAAHPLS